MEVKGAVRFPRTLAEENTYLVQIDVSGDYWVYTLSISDAHVTPKCLENEEKAGKINLFTTAKDLRRNTKLSIVSIQGHFGN